MRRFAFIGLFLTFAFLMAAGSLYSMGSAAAPTGGPSAPLHKAALPPSSPATCSLFTTATSANYPSSSNYLRAVVAIAPDDIWAAGDYYDGVISRPLIEHWTGSGWGIVQVVYP